MGKNWKGQRRTWKKANGNSSSNDIGSCKGYCGVMATCDTARERGKNHS